MSRSTYSLYALFFVIAFACHVIRGGELQRVNPPAAQLNFNDELPEVVSVPTPSTPFISAENNFPQRSCEDCENRRAGCPQKISCLARPSENCRYFGYYVGGGLPFGGEPRYMYQDGTWGWDYGGILFNKRVDLNWGHGSRAQGGTGAYRSDGPKLKR